MSSTPRAVRSAANAGSGLAFCLLEHKPRGEFPRSPLHAARLHQIVRTRPHPSFLELHLAIEHRTEVRRPAGIT